MKAYRSSILSFGVAGLLVLAGCGNALDGGSDPSGSIVRVVGIAANPPEAFSPDLFVSVCSVDADGVPDYEDGLFVSKADVTLLNDARPNAPTDAPGNTFVTMSRYRVDFTGLNKTVSIPSIDGPGQTVGIAPDGTSVMTVVVMDYATHEYIRSHYPTIGNTESLTLRATITMWGEDAFGARISETAEVTLVVDNYDRC